MGLRPTDHSYINYCMPVYISSLGCINECPVESHVLEYSLAVAIRPQQHRTSPTGLNFEAACFSLPILDPWYLILATY